MTMSHDHSDIETAGHQGGGEGGAAQQGPGAHPEEGTGGGCQVTRQLYNHWGIQEDGKTGRPEGVA